MPTYILRRSPDVAEYLLWSTVVDAPVSSVLTRHEAMDYATRTRSDLDEDLAKAQARRRLHRTDEQGTSELTPHYGYETQRIWWRENAPQEFGQPHEVDRGVFVGRVGGRDELFDICQNDMTKETANGSTS